MRHDNLRWANRSVTKCKLSELYDERRTQSNLQTYYITREKTLYHAQENVISRARKLWRSCAAGSVQRMRISVQPRHDKLLWRAHYNKGSGSCRKWAENLNRNHVQHDDSCGRNTQDAIVKGRLIATMIDLLLAARWQEIRTWSRRPHWWRKGWKTCLKRRLALPPQKLKGAWRMGMFDHRRRTTRNKTLKVRNMCHVS